WTYPTIKRHYEAMAALVEAAGAQDEDIKVKYASTIRGWQNTMKNYGGQLEGFQRIDASKTKHAEENAVLDWLRGQDAKGSPALAAHARLLELVVAECASRGCDLGFGQLERTGAIGTATVLYRFAIEAEKPDAQRGAGYQARDLPGFEGSLKQMERRDDAS